MPPGTTVLLVNSDTLEVTATDWEGFFSLPASPGDTLIASFTNMTVYQTIITDSTDTLHIALEESLNPQFYFGTCNVRPSNPPYRHNLTWVQGMDLGHGVLEYRQHLYGIGRKSSAAERFLFRIIEPGLSWYTGTEDFFSIFTQLNDFPIGNSTLLNRQLMPYINLGWTVDQRFQKGKPRAELGLEINPLPKGSIRRFHVHLDARYRITQLPSAIDGLSYSRLYAGISLRYRPHYR